MYHNCASLCSLCQGEGGTKTIDIWLAFLNYSNKSQHAADYLFGSNSKFSVGFRATATLGLRHYTTSITVSWVLVY